MSNDYYVSTGAPTTLSRGASSAVRAQFSAVEDGFDAMPAEAVLIGGLTYSGTTTGSADAYVLSISDKVAAYTNGLRIVAKIHAVNTTASTINVNALGVITIKRPNGDALAAGDLPVSGNVCMVYNSTSGYFMLEAPTNATLQAYVDEAEAAADNSTNSAANVLAASEWVSGTTYARGDVRWSPIDYRNYRRKTAGAGTTDPSADATNWAGIGGIVYTPATATTHTTLTSTSALLSITTTGYGIIVTLPDASVCQEGPLHIIRNAGGFPVLVKNSAGTLLGFVNGGATSHVELVDNATAAGVWAISNIERMGWTAALFTTNFVGGLSTTSPSGFGSVDMDGDIEIITGYRTSDNYIVAVAYKRSTATFGAEVVVRAAAIGSSTGFATVKHSSTQMMTVSCTSGSTALEAVIVSVNTSTLVLTVNTAATATLSGNLSSFADGCGIVAIPSAANSFVISYTVATPAAQLRAISVSGTTVTIGSATVLSGTAGGLIAATADKVIAVSTATSHLYTRPYTVSGSTLSPGTGTDTDVGGADTYTLNKLFALGNYWCVLAKNSTVQLRGGIITLSGTTTTISWANLFTLGSITDAIAISSAKVLVMSGETTSNANILTNTAGTASAGTAITVGAGTARYGTFVTGTNAVVYANAFMAIVDCSGSSPVLTGSLPGSTGLPATASNSVLVRSSGAVYGSEFAATLGTVASYTPSLQISGKHFGAFPPAISGYVGTTNYRGASDGERWSTGASALSKYEVAP